MWRRLHHSQGLELIQMGDVVNIKVTGMGEEFHVSFRWDPNDCGQGSFRRDVIEPVTNILMNMIEQRAKQLANQRTM